MEYNTVITGGCGFIGSHLVEQEVRKNRKVLVLDRFSNDSSSHPWYEKNHTNVSLHRFDVKDALTYPTNVKHVDAMIHAAGCNGGGLSLAQPKMYVDTNLMGTMHAIQWARSVGVKRFIYIASSSCYGVNEAVPIDEEAPIDLLSPYALTKYLGEQLVLHWGLVYGMQVISVRLSSVYGGASPIRKDENSWISRCRQAAIDKVPILLDGDGEQTRDFVDIDDVTTGIARIYEAEKCLHRIYNMGSGCETSLKSVAEEFGCSIRFTGKKAGLPVRHCINSNRIQKEYDWNPKKYLLTN